LSSAATAYIYPWTTVRRKKFRAHDRRGATGGEEVERFMMPQPGGKVKSIVGNFLAGQDIRPFSRAAFPHAVGKYPGRAR
jgi:hypothetical protein